LIGLRLLDTDWAQTSLTDFISDETELPPWPAEMRQSGSLRQWMRVAFRSEQLVGVLWGSEPGVIAMEHYPYDETVIVIEGDVTLTPRGGTAATYRPGDIFLLPRGYAGTWAMPEFYKKLSIIHRPAFEAEGG